MAPKRKEEGVLQERVPPKQRGFGTLSVTEKEGHRTRTRLDEWCRANGRVSDKGKPDADAGINALLDRDEDKSTTVPVASLEPITAALHDLERQVQGNKFKEASELVGAIRDIRRELEALPK